MGSGNGSAIARRVFRAAGDDGCRHEHRAAKVALPNGKEKALADHVWTVEEIVGLVQEGDVVILK